MSYNKLVNGVRVLDAGPLPDGKDLFTMTRAKSKLRTQSLEEALPNEAKFFEKVSGGKQKKKKASLSVGFEPFPLLPLSDALPQNPPLVTSHIEFT